MACFHCARRSNQIESRTGLRVGIDLGDIVVRHPRTLADYSGKRLAFDAWNILYQFLSSIRGPDGSPLTDREGRITSHLQGLFNRTGNLVEAGIRPVFVFDGVPHPLKSETLAQRSARKEKATKEMEAEQAKPEFVAAKAALESATTDEERKEARKALTVASEGVRTKAQQTSRLTPPMVESAKELLTALGVPVLEAPGEGEAQASWMAQQGIVDAVVSQDFDAILFGAPRLVRNLGVAGRRKMPGKQVWVEAPPEEVTLAESLGQAQLSREQLIDVALLVGTDFHAGIKGIGAKSAVSLIRADGSLDALLARLDASGSTSAVERYILEQRENLDVRGEVRRIFLEPAHTAEVGDLSLRAPDAARVQEIMVERHGFNRERVVAGLAKYQAGRGKQAQRTLF